MKMNAYRVSAAAYTRTDPKENLFTETLEKIVLLILNQWRGSLNRSYK